MGSLITVTGCVGGIGTSTFAYALGLAARPAVVIEGVASGAPLDLLVGAEQAPGVRWGQVRIRSDAFNVGEVRRALVQWQGVSLLAADREGVMDPLAAQLLVEALRRDGIVVLELPYRHPLRDSLRPDLDLVLLPPTLPGIAALALARRPHSRPIVVDIGTADLTQRQLVEVLQCEPPRLRWQRSVRLACTAGAALPASSDPMRVAERELTAVAA